MFISPQALTKQIGLLEEEIGGILFVRNATGITLTPLGETAYAKLRIAADNFDKAFALVQETAQHIKPQINIGIFSALPQDELVSPLLSFLIANYSDYQIGIELIEMSEGRKKLLEGKIDMLLTNTHTEDTWENCDRYSFGQSEAKVIVSLVHPLSMKSEITVEDMKQYEFLKMDASNSTYVVPKQQTFYENIPCKGIKNVANFNTLLTMLKQENAFAVVPMVFANFQQAQLKSFDYPGKAIVFNTALIVRKNTQLSVFNQIVQDVVEEFELKQF